MQQPDWYTLQKPTIANGKKHVQYGMTGGIERSALMKENGMLYLEKMAERHITSVKNYYCQWNGSSGPCIAGA